MEKFRQQVAVFGSLKKGFGNHRVLGDSKLLGVTRTEPKFTMVSMGGFPGLLNEGDTSIEIEVYEVISEDTFQNLDWLEGYPHFYNRMEIETEFGKSWIYFNEDKRYRNYPKVESGVWTRS